MGFSIEKRMDLKNSMLQGQVGNEGIHSVLWFRFLWNILSCIQQFKL